MALDVVVLTLFGQHVIFIYITSLMSFLTHSKPNKQKCSNNVACVILNINQHFIFQNIILIGFFDSGSGKLGDPGIMHVLNLLSATCCTWHLLLRYNLCV